MLDNIANLLMTVSLLAALFEFPTNVALRNMVPGTAIGVLVGDLLFAVLAFRLAQQTGRNTITAMPLGLDTPSTLGMIFFVLGPAFLAAKARGLEPEAAAIHTWHVGICCIFISGLFKLVCSVGSNWIRRSLPRAGLLGSLAAVALVLISFLPLLEILHSPIVGFVSLAVVLTTLVARIDLPRPIAIATMPFVLAALLVYVLEQTLVRRFLPWYSPQVQLAVFLTLWLFILLPFLVFRLSLKMPGALGALMIGAVLYLLLQTAQTWDILPAALTLPKEQLAISPREALFPTEWLTAFRFEWIGAFRESLNYLPIVIPFALATVVGGIDCTESAAAVGDEYDTGQIIAVESLATLIAALCGGVIQTTPYIGHPAYKAMGARTAYVLAAALFVGSAGVLGYFGFLYVVIPKVTVYPILIFIGLEIAAQSFHATPVRHYPAVVFACVPALAQLALIFAEKLLPQISGPLNPQLGDEIETIRMLSSGFIVISLVWASALAALIDHRLIRAGVFFLICAVLTPFGIMHSPLPGSAMFLPWQLTAEFRRPVYQYTLGYFLVAVLLFLWGSVAKPDMMHAVEGDDVLLPGDHTDDA
jgi:AGZA family xanthine/uracil permease-like MFS transporter